MAYESKAINKFVSVVLVTILLLGYIMVGYCRYPKSPFVFWGVDNVKNAYFAQSLGLGVNMVKLDEETKNNLIRDLRCIVVTRPVSRYDPPFMKGQGTGTNIQVPIIVEMKNGKCYRLGISRNWDSKLSFLHISPWDSPVIPKDEIYMSKCYSFRVALSPISMEAAQKTYKLQCICSDKYEYPD